MAAHSPSPIPFPPLPTLSLLCISICILLFRHTALYDLCKSGEAHDIEECERMMGIMTNRSGIQSDIMNLNAVSL